MIVLLTYTTSSLPCLAIYQNYDVANRIILAFVRQHAHTYYFKYEILHWLNSEILIRGNR